MSYFKDLNFIKYDFTTKSDAVPIIDTIVDVMQRTQLNISEEELNNLCDEYVVADGVTPETLAGILYNDPFLHWTILYINNISDIHQEWPLTSTSLNDFVTKKYGAGNEENTHHYETDEGVVIDLDFALEVYGTTPRTVTNYVFEYIRNEEKRHIRVIKPAYIINFVQTYKDAIVNG